MIKKQINLPKKFEMKGRQAIFFHDENWITNGQFMIKKHLVKDCFKYCPQVENGPENLERVIPLENGLEWVKTNKLIDLGSSCYIRIFSNKDKEEIGFKEDYIKHFKVEKVLGLHSGPFKTPENDLVLMNCRI